MSLTLLFDIVIIGNILSFLIFLDAVASQSSGLKVSQSVTNVKFRCYTGLVIQICCYPYQNVIILKGVRA